MTLEITQLHPPKNMPDEGGHHSTLKKGFFRLLFERFALQIICVTSVRPRDSCPVSDDLYKQPLHWLDVSPARSLDWRPQHQNHVRMRQKRHLHYRRSCERKDVLLHNRPRLQCGRLIGQEFAQNTRLIRMRRPCQQMLIAQRLRFWDAWP